MVRFQCRCGKLTRSTSRLKLPLCLLAGGMLFAITKYTFLRSFSSESSISNNEDGSADTNPVTPSTVTGCSRTDRLGVPKYVSDACSKEGRQNCEKFACVNLLDGNDKTVYETARAFMKNNTRTKLEPEDFIRLTENCERFLVERGFKHKMALQDEEDDYPIAFNILAHGNVEQVERLIYAIYRPRNRICVHFDAKSKPGSQEALEAITRCLPNVFSASRRIQIFWGSYSRLEADIQCMRDHLESGKPWKYLINTAGQGFPIRSVREMVEILKIYNGANDVEGMHGERVIRSRFEHKFEVNKDGIIALKEPKERHPVPPHEIDIVRGSAFGVLSRDFVHFIVTDQKAKDFLDWSREIFSPDELYFSTLHHTFNNPHIRSPGSYSGNPNEKPWLAAYANWGGDPCSGKERHGICVFGVEDLPRLVNRKEFFVNKLLADFEPMALECLRAWIDYKDSCTGTELLDTNFYRSLPFIKQQQ